MAAAVVAFVAVVAAAIVLLPLGDFGPASGADPEVAVRLAWPHRAGDVVQASPAAIARRLDRVALFQGDRVALLGLPQCGQLPPEALLGFR